MNPPVLSRRANVGPPASEPPGKLPSPAPTHVRFETTGIDIGVAVNGEAEPSPSTHRPCSPDWSLIENTNWSLPV